MYDCCLWTFSFVVTAAVNGLKLAFFTIACGTKCEKLRYIVTLSAL